MRAALAGVTVAAALASGCFAPWCFATSVGTQPATAAATPLPAQLPLRRADQEAAVTSLGWRSLFLLLMVGAGGGAWLLWRRGMVPGGGEASLHGRLPGELPAVRRLSSHALTPQASVHAVRWQGEELLLGCTAQQVTLLARRPHAGREAGQE